MTGLALNFESNAFKIKSHPQKMLEDLLGAFLLMLNVFSVSGLALALLLGRIPKIDRGRRSFLRASSVAACAVPAIVLGAGIITRKDFHVRELDIAFPDLPPDLHGLRLLQISDIHMSTFFSRSDVRRVVDLCNNLRPDLAFITGDLITDEHDPLDECLLELRRLRSGSGIWGCMGNHELYAKCQRYTKREAAALGMDFLRYESRLLRFGNSSLNLMGVDYQKPGMHLEMMKGMVRKDAFNLLLSHTPAIFPDAVSQGVDLTLSGHTHGGQLNLEVAGTNLNMVDLVTPYTKGLYRQGPAAVYVNSGLGTIGLPVRIGAPPEITVIRLCNS